MKRSIALVSARAAHGLDEDMPPLLAAAAAAGVHAEIANWDDAQVDWARFDAALLRSAWDYTERLGEFLAWVGRTAAVTTLLNPPAVVRWNSDKHYLLHLARAGAAVVASAFVEPDQDAAAILERFLAQHANAEIVVKPAVGAGSRDTRRHARSAVTDMQEQVRRLLRVGRSALLQPYLPSVDRDGETALIYIGGHFSHAIRKGPLLPAGGPSTQALFAAEEITTRSPGADELAVAHKVLSGVPFPPLLYARVDLIRGEDGGPRLLELEITEPSLFFAHGPGSAQRLILATLARLPAH